MSPCYRTTGSHHSSATIDGMLLATEASFSTLKLLAYWDFSMKKAGDWTAPPSGTYTYIPSLRSGDTRMSPMRNISRFGTSARKYR